MFKPSKRTIIVATTAATGLIAGASILYKKHKEFLSEIDRFMNSDSATDPHLDYFIELEKESIEILQSIYGDKWIDVYTFKKYKPNASQEEFEMFIDSLELEDNCDCCEINNNENSLETESFSESDLFSNELDKGYCVKKIDLTKCEPSESFNPLDIKSSEHPRLITKMSEHPKLTDHSSSEFLLFKSPKSPTELQPSLLQPSFYDDDSIFRQTVIEFIFNASNALTPQNIRNDFKKQFTTNDQKDQANKIIWETRLKSSPEYQQELRKLGLSITDAKRIADKFVLFCHDRVHNNEFSLKKVCCAINATDVSRETKAKIREVLYGRVAGALCGQVNF